MRTEFVYGKYDNFLGEFLAVIDKCPVDKRHVVPEGYGYSFHWQLGHLLTATEFHVYTLSQQPTSIPANYDDIFAYGTKATDWTEEPPAWDLLISQLRDQQKRVAELKDKLDVPVEENFFNAQNIGELILCTVLHMSHHVGIVTGMLKAVK